MSTRLLLPTLLGLSISCTPTTSMSSYVSRLIHVFWS